VLGRFLFDIHLVYGWKVRGMVTCSSRLEYFVVAVKHLLRPIDLIEHTKSRRRPRRVLFDAISGVSESINRAHPNGVSVRIDFEKIKPIVHCAPPA
jgi:hypothetical protein